MEKFWPSLGITRHNSRRLMDMLLKQPILNTRWLLFRSISPPESYLTHDHNRNSRASISQETDITELTYIIIPDINVKDVTRNVRQQFRLQVKTFSQVQIMTETYQPKCGLPLCFFAVKRNPWNLHKKMTTKRSQRTLLILHVYDIWITFVAVDNWH